MNAAFRGGVARSFAVGLALLLLSIAAGLFVPGCSRAEEDTYDPSLRYPLRSDPIVVKVPATQPTRPPDPGQMDDSIKKLPSLGGQTLDPNNLTAAQKDELTKALEEHFGTPAAPRVALASTEQTEALHLAPDKLAKGSAAYRVRCADCHGLGGNGRGPSAAWNYPYARDFRSGVFKFTTGAANNGKPTTTDIKQTIRRGVPGTPMPVFDLIPDVEVQNLAGYSIHLSIRGEVELRVMKSLLTDDGGVANITVAVEDSTRLVLSKWMEAQTPSIRQFTASPSTPESVVRGHALFVDNRGGAGCISCHEAYGKKEVYRYDVWGLPARVANLTDSKYRWGREPHEIAEHIRRGIAPANMPANPYLSEEQVRDLTNFLLELPYPAKLPPEVRQAVDALR